MGSDLRGLGAFGVADVSLALEFFGVTTAVSVVDSGETTAPLTSANPPLSTSFLNFFWLGQC